MAGRVTMEFQHLWLAVSLFIFIVFLLSQTNVFRQALSETVTSWKSRILLQLFFHDRHIGNLLGNQDR